MIKPTVGRIVWFYPSRNEDKIQPEPQAAIITGVHSDNCVSICIFPFGSSPSPKTSVRLRQDNDPAELHEHCEWMPYQKGQAAKTEELEKAAANNRPS